MIDSYFFIVMAETYGEFFVIYKIMNTYFEKRWKYSLYIFYIYVIIDTILQYLTLSSEWYDSLEIYVSALTICFIIFKGDVWKRIYYLMLIFVMLKVANVAAMRLIGILPMDTPEIFINTIIIAQVGLLYLGYLVLKKKKMDTTNFKRSDWIIFITISITALCYFSYVDFTWRTTLEENIFTSWIIQDILLVFMMFMYFLFHLLLTKLTQKNIDITKTTLQLQSEEYNKKLHNEIINANELNRKLRHDMKHHMLVVEHMIEEDPRKATAYIQEVYGHINNVRAAQSENQILNYIIDTKASLAGEKEISFTYFIQDSLLNLQDFDLVTILGNLLDNAIEAQSYVDDKWIELSISNTATATFIHIENACDGEALQTKDNHYLTRKKNKAKHGYGIRNVEESLKNYNGSMTFKKEASIFHVEIMIPYAN